MHQFSVSIIPAEIFSPKPIILEAETMVTKSAAKQDTKIALLETGMDIMLEKGYTNTGIQEILTALRVPKGSFYHYFDSKENYAAEIIKHYDQAYSANLIRTLRNPKETPVQRLRAYCQTSKENLEMRQCSKGCLIGNLSQEMSDQSELLRTELSTVITKWRDMFSSCIEEGQSAGEIRKTVSAEQLAEFFLSGWSGAVMRAKTLKNSEPMQTFIDLMFEQVLKP
jgi:TetR/AcrR family transcriptional regulator, transcriptional repressor for nem operon